MLALETTLEIRMNLKYLLLTSGLLLTSSLSAADFHQYESARNDKSASRGAEQRAAAAGTNSSSDEDEDQPKPDGHEKPAYTQDLDADVAVTAQDRQAREELAEDLEN